MSQSSSILAEIPAKPDVACFRLMNRFDQLAANELREALMAEKRKSIVIDFLGVTDFDDSTLAMLTVTLVVLHRRGSTFQIRGLSGTQQRFFDHFGVSIEEESGRVHFFPPEEQPFSD